MPQPDSWTQGSNACGTLGLLTMNIAHGSALGRTPLLQTSGRIRYNLREIARLLARESPDVVALQEVDLRSVWNGGFDHQHYIAELAEYPFSFSGSHKEGRLFNYGTGLLSRLPLHDPASIKFRRPAVRPGKGFVMSTIEWQANPGDDVLLVDVVSVHLDFLSRQQRVREIELLVATLASRPNPRIVMGDFNTEYLSTDAVLLHLERALNLYTFEPHARHVTYPLLGRRLDWILVSPCFELGNFRVLGGKLSDHHPVAAEISWRGW